MYFHTGSQVASINDFIIFNYLMHFKGIAIAYSGFTYYKSKITDM